MDIIEIFARGIPIGVAADIGWFRTKSETCEIERVAEGDILARNFLVIFFVIEAELRCVVEPLDDSLEGEFLTFRFGRRIQAHVVQVISAFGRSDEFWTCAGDGSDGIAFGIENGVCSGVARSRVIAFDIVIDMDRVVFAQIGEPDVFFLTQIIFGGVISFADNLERVSDFLDGVRIGEIFPLF